VENTAPFFSKKSTSRGRDQSLLADSGEKRRALRKSRIQSKKPTLDLERKKMAIPDFQTLMLPLLRLAADKESSVSDSVERLANDFDLSQEERATLSPQGAKQHSPTG
jgi:hypothetical protein